MIGFYEKSHEAWVPVPEVAERSGGNITPGWLGLPNGLDIEQIELHVGNLERALIGFGGFHKVILGAQKGEKDQVNMSFGSNNDGVATVAGSASITKAKSNEHNLHKPDGRESPLFRRARTVELSWNSAALNDRLRPHEQYDPAVRAKQLQREIRSAGRKAVVEENMYQAYLDTRPHMRGMATLRDAMLTGYFSYGYFADSPTAIDYGTFLFISTSLMPYAMGAIHNTLFAEDDVESARPIAGIPFATIRPERAILGSALLAASPLVRAAPSNS